jgi:hypothetical protein
MFVCWQRVLDAVDIGYRIIVVPRRGMQLV